MSSADNETNRRSRSGAVRFPPRLTTPTNSYDDNCDNDCLCDVASVAGTSVTSPSCSDYATIKSASSAEGSLFDVAFDESGGESSESEDESFRGSARDRSESIGEAAGGGGGVWAVNSLLAAARTAASRGGVRGINGNEDCALLKTVNTMDVTHDSRGRVKRACNLAEEAEFGRQYLSVLFCGMGEVLDCGARDRGARD
eukprot:CAMPEP_0183294054 /NCGR_PEP_ID=MMETSP0160_2-20130417/2526_1 /TAXON_ID=2839 ORGANISM="Odontella Sinensis, Strain Grunow 1884" /NCGR_SAMPLE_ID=MMETSP0160_2 /ASSEMBLY_ACC=CAM_ASM_000250 /LENGTH=198 /DNA_ID=CAMNT_0025455285 /DNA_START=223 /DNA_END=819 /DNA_ORIENTATION=-